MAQRIITFHKAVQEALTEEMKRDDSVFIMGEDVKYLGITKALWAEFGNDRIINTPIAESAFVGAGVGAAITGMKPVVYFSRCDFTLYAMDSIVNEAAKWTFQTGGQFKVPLVLLVGTGGYRGSGCHHSQSFESLYMNVPGIDIVMPSTPYDAKGLLKSALRTENPVMFFLHTQLMNLDGPVPKEEYFIPFGASKIRREGDDVTVVSIGFMIQKALDAAVRLEEEGLNVEVVDLRTLIPLDIKSVVKSVMKTGKLVTVEESCRTGGIGAEVAASIAEEAFNSLKAPIKRIANPNAMLPYKDVNEAHVLPQVDTIVSEIRELCNIV